MNRKRLITGIVFLVAGAIVIIAALIAMHRISEAQGFTEDVKNFFTHNPQWWNPIIEFFGGEAQEKIDDYSASATFALIVGIILAIIGAVLAFISRRRKQ